MLFKIPIYMFILSIFVGCSKTIEAPSIPSLITDSYLLENMSVNYDEDLKQTKIETMTYHSNSLNNEKISVNLIADIYDTDSKYTLHFKKSKSYYMWITYRSKEWGEFNRVLTIHGETIIIKPHNFNIREGIYTESFPISLSREQLDMREDIGFDFLVLGSKATIAVKLPSLYVSTFLTKINAYAVKIPANMNKISVNAPEKSAYGN